MEALFVYGDSDQEKSATSDYRIHTPAKYLKAAGHTIHLQGSLAYSVQHDGREVEIDTIDYSNIPEVVLFERNILPERIEKLRQAGAKRIIATFDDHYGFLPKYMSSSRFWHANYKRFLKALSMVDFVIVPSYELVYTFSGGAVPRSKIKYVGNYLDPDLWPRGVADPDSQIVGWGGSAGHIETWKNRRIVRGIAAAMEGLPDWQLHLHCNPEIETVLGKLPHVLHGEWMTIDSWVQAVSKFGIGLAPLSGTYDIYRSNLKVVEYSRLGVPWLASFKAPYLNSGEGGGYLVREEDWKRLYAFALDSKNRQELRQEGLEWSDSWLMPGHVDEYEEILWPS